MPIKKIEKSIVIGNNLPTLGRLRKGEEKGEKRPGRELEYFRFVAESGFEQHAPMWDEVYGAEATRIEPIALFATKIDDAFQYWQEEYSANKLIHRCDGETQYKWWNNSAQAEEKGEKPCALLADKGQCGCKPTGRLKFIPVEFCHRIGTLGFVILTTTSEYDIRQQLGFLTDMDAMFVQTGAGALHQMQFALYRKEESTNYVDPKTKQRTTRKHYMAYIVRVAGTFSPADLLDAPYANGVQANHALPDGDSEYDLDMPMLPEPELEPVTPITLEERARLDAYFMKATNRSFDDLVGKIARWLNRTVDQVLGMSEGEILFNIFKFIHAKQVVMNATTWLPNGDSILLDEFIPYAVSSKELFAKGWTDDVVKKLNQPPCFMLDATNTPQLQKYVKKGE